VIQGALRIKAEEQHCKGPGGELVKVVVRLDGEGQRGEVFGEVEGF
jgi:hypothetical protein